MLPSPVRALLRYTSLRFIVTGGLSLGVDVGSLFILHGLLAVWLPLATTAAFGLSFGVNFLLNRAWTFEADDRLTRHLWRYTLLTMANLGLNVVLITGLSHVGVPYILAKIFVTTCLSVMNYFVSRKWIFTMAEPAQGAGRQPQDALVEGATPACQLPQNSSATANEAQQPATASN